MSRARGGILWKEISEAGRSHSMGSGIHGLESYFYSKSNRKFLRGLKRSDIIWFQTLKITLAAMYRMHCRRRRRNRKTSYEAIVVQARNYGVSKLRWENREGQRKSVHRGGRMMLAKSEFRVQRCLHISLSGHPRRRGLAPIASHLNTSLLWKLLLQKPRLFRKQNGIIVLEQSLHI